MDYRFRQTVTQGALLLRRGREGNRRNRRGEEGEKGREEMNMMGEEG